MPATPSKYLFLRNGVDNCRWFPLSVGIQKPRPPGVVGSEKRGRGNGGFRVFRFGQYHRPRCHFWSRHGGRSLLIVSWSRVGISERTQRLAEYLFSVILRNPTEVERMVVGRDSHKTTSPPVRQPRACESQISQRHASLACDP